MKRTAMNLVDNDLMGEDHPEEDDPMEVLDAMGNPISKAFSGAATGSRVADSNLPQKSFFEDPFDDPLAAPAGAGGPAQLPSALFPKNAAASTGLSGAAGPAQLVAPRPAKLTNLNPN